MASPRTATVLLRQMFFECNRMVGTAKRPCTREKRARFMRTLRRAAELMRGPVVGEVGEVGEKDEQEGERGEACGRRSASGTMISSGYDVQSSPLALSMTPHT